MANTDGPKGLRPLGATSQGGPPRSRPYTKDASATVVYEHDVVTLEADGGIAAGGTPGTTLYRGVALHHHPTLTAGDVLVMDSPGAMFAAQGDDGTDLLAADEGLNANLIFGAGSALTLMSGHEIDSNTKAVTATLDVKLEKLLKISGNDYGEFAKWVVTFNKHSLLPNVAGL